MKPEGLKPTRKPFSVDVFNIVAPLQMWSGATFTKLLQSHVLRDISIAVTKGNRGVININERGMAKAPTQRGSVNLRQVSSFLDFVPEERWKQFVNAIYIWSASSGWWETNTPTWKDRDDWREEMGVDRIHPLRISGSNSEIKIFFKSSGNVIPLVPDGYRQASLEEFSEVFSLLPKTPYFMEGLRAVVMNIDNDWLVVSDSNGETRTDTIPFKKVENPEKFFSEISARIPIVKE